MFSSGIPSSSVVVSLVVIVVLLATPSLARPAFHVDVSRADIKAICSSTQNPSFCLKLLNSNPKVGSANLPGLAGIVVDIASAKVADNLAYVQKLIKTASAKPPPRGGPSMKERLSSCAENYQDATDDIQDIKKALKSKDYFTAQTVASALLDEPGTCDDALEGAASQQLSRRNKQLEYVASVILAILARLRGHNN